MSQTDQQIIDKFRQLPADKVQQILKCIGVTSSTPTTLQSSTSRSSVSTPRRTDIDSSSTSRRTSPSPTNHSTTATNSTPTSIPSTQTFSKPTKNVNGSDAAKPTCSICEKSFANNTNLKIHITRLHGPLKKVNPTPALASASSSSPPRKSPRQSATSSKSNNQYKLVCLLRLLVRLTTHGAMRNRIVKNRIKKVEYNHLLNPQSYLKGALMT